MKCWDYSNHFPVSYSLSDHTLQLGDMSTLAQTTTSESQVSETGPKLYRQSLVPNFSWVWLTLHESVVMHVAVSVCFFIEKVWENKTKRLCLLKENL